MTHTVAAFLGSIITALFCALIWAGKIWLGKHIEHAVKHEYDERLEERKAELQQATERYKSDLANSAHERQLRFSHLHERAAKIVAETYHRLWAVMTALSDYVRVYEHSAMGSKEDRRKVLSEKIADFHNYFYPRRLFLSRALADRVVAFHKKIIELTTEFMFKVEKREEDDQEASRVHTWVRVNEQLQTEAQPLYDSLEDEFRKILGSRSWRPTARTPTTRPARLIHLKAGRLFLYFLPADRLPVGEGL
jgi:hypothetical protein